MENELIHDRGRGPEIKGTRITVYDLLPYFLQEEVTEEEICKRYEPLTPRQVAAARAYILNNADVILAEHLKIEARLAAGNPPDGLVEQAKKAHSSLLRFKDWLADRSRSTTASQAAQAVAEGDRSSSPQFPTFHEWLAERESRPAGSE